MPMHWPKHRAGYHYAQKKAEQANSGQRNADETHRSSSGKYAAPTCVEKNGETAGRFRACGRVVDNALLSVSVDAKLPNNHRRPALCCGHCAAKPRRTCQDL